MIKYVLQQKSRDDLQAVIAAVRSTDLPIDVQFITTAEKKNILYVEDVFL